MNTGQIDVDSLLPGCVNALARSFIATDHFHSLPQGKCLAGRVSGMRTRSDKAALGFFISGTLPCALIPMEGRVARGPLTGACVNGPADGLSAVQQRVTLRHHNSCSTEIRAGRASEPGALHARCTRRYNPCWAKAPATLIPSGRGSAAPRAEGFSWKPSARGCNGFDCRKKTLCAKATVRTKAVLNRKLWPLLRTRAGELQSESNAGRDGKRFKGCSVRFPIGQCSLMQPHADSRYRGTWPC